MTNEEAIAELKDVHEYALTYKDNRTNEAFDMAISALESQRWIPVEERLPEHDNVYLTYDLHGGLSMMEYHTSDDGTDYYGKGFYSADENGYMWKDDKVTHWLSIQKPPKEEST